MQIVCRRCSSWNIFAFPPNNINPEQHTEIGEKAASMLLDMIDKKDAINSVKLKPVLVVRDSV